jgi:hypothetical protein
MAPATFGAVEQGDAGELPATSQKVGPPGPLTSIEGTTSGSQDRDVFQICLTGGGNFSAETRKIPPEDGTNFDSQLFLLDKDGKGVYANDDHDGRNPGPSTLPANHDLTPRTPDVYYLAISHFDFDPVSSAGRIFPNASTGVVGPTGSGGHRSMTGWMGVGGSPGGSYTIFLTGAKSCIPDTAPPQIALRAPEDGAVFARGELVAADYECVEEESGSGLESCEGSAPDGQPIDTATVGEKTFEVTASDRAGNKASVTHTYTVVDREPPLITLASPLDGAEFTLGELVRASYSCSDEPGGSGLQSCAGNVPNGSPIDTNTPGPHTFTVRAQDRAGNVSTATAAYTVLFDFEGFLPPVDNPPAVNRVKAGRTVPMKFRLGGYRGRDVLADGYPRSVPMACGTGAELDGGKAARAASRPRLAFKARNDVYTYRWKTEKGWAGSCRQFVLKLVDGSVHHANFRFTGKAPRPPRPQHDDDGDDD